MSETSAIKGCGFCRSKDLKSVHNFGNVGLAGAFLKADQFSQEALFPMTLVFCENCSLLQVAEHIPPSEVFGPDYFYYSSSIQTLRTHFESYAKDMTSFFEDHDNDLLVEIGCNDGVLIEPLVKLGCKRVIGIDPSTNVLAKIKDGRPTLINDFFSSKSAQQIVHNHGHARLIMANNVFAHISDIVDFVEGIEILLSENGVFVFEVHYIRNLIEEFQYDMIYHEHLYNYSLTSLQKFFRKFGLEVFQVKEIPIHAGSMRYHVKRIKNNDLVRSEEVERTLIEEKINGYDRYETFLDYSKKISYHREILLKTIQTLKNQLGQKIVGYGASGRANTILQFCDLDTNLLDYIIDDAPAKQGFYTPRTHIEIKSRDALIQDRPDYVLCFAWSFMDEIIRRNQEYLASGGVFIVPLPEPTFLYSDKSGAITKVKWNDYIDLAKDPNASVNLGKRWDVGLNT